MKKADSRANILDKAVSLFARLGYSGMSMRKLGDELGVTAAALYYHFPNKESLYFECMNHAYEQKQKTLSQILSSKGSAGQRLLNFLNNICRMMDQDPEFLILIKREMLDGDEGRIKKLAQDYFYASFSELSNLCHEMAPGYDPHMLANSIFGLVIYHFESKSMRPHLPGSKEEHDSPRVIATHIANLLLGGMG